MSKTVKTVHHRTETFVITKAELIAALKAKYGDDPVFETGRLVSVFCSMLLPGEGGQNTEVAFQTELGQMAGGSPA
ncbi:MULTISPECIES: hypothetical protein [Pseudomonas]|uniref:Uncharacterized protein n=1 Tax=Pseudomonas guariconensis TaxID=1288410 RepID=A0AAX0VPP2_9PSED|nr:MULTISPECIES: hypothetical protein [Pseudomonas]MBH3360441.1 hypothetical protein [Pseudomonas guariconensis]MCL8306363.1 hypothetical protein [Pseudomonas putida]PLV12886.1 hypothetical protein CXG49_25040 [Pseudomonas guariconensis]PLV20957.1 hypothetical protein CXG53_25130 [Pseudomonas guariconensis]PLV26586.1 hypothetical protein CXG51_25135 [Pseudomonas guariconensis]